MDKPTPLDWEEDFSHENGRYQNQCTECKQLFLGHKRRSICKQCAERSVMDKPTPRTPIDPVARYTELCGYEGRSLKSSQDAIRKLAAELREECARVAYSWVGPDEYSRNQAANIGHEIRSLNTAARQAETNREVAAHQPSNPAVAAPTPRTDAAVFFYEPGNPQTGVVPAKIARELERERNELEQTVARLRAVLLEIYESIPASFDPNDLMVQRHSRALNAIPAAIKEKP